MKIIFILIGLLVSFSCKNKTDQRNPEDFLRPVEITIPVRYKFTADIGIIIEKYTGFTITCYSNRKEETDDTPNHTATGRMVYDGSCAVSQDYFRKKIFPGDILYVKELDRFFIVEDTTNPRHKKLVDVFYFRGEKPPVPKPIKNSTIYVIRMPNTPQVRFIHEQ